MQMLKFEANDMSEALEKVRESMGEDAMIVRSRTVRKGGLFGLAAKDRVEVHAALNRTEAQPVEARPAARPSEPRREKPTADLGGRLESLEAKLDSLLLGLGVGTVRPTQSQPESASSYSDEALRELAEQLPICGGITLTDGPTVVALVGSTGVGKTTTLLKLAGQFSLRYGKKVTVVTADTFRLGAVEQLKAFTRVFQVGLRVVLSPEEMAQTVAELSDQDLILIDTPGGSQRDKVYQSQLGAFLQAAGPHETHLVLSATARPCVIKECLQSFAQLDADRLIFTKLDEAMALHETFSTILGAGLPLSYLGYGQNIPDEVYIADETKLAELMIGTDAAAE